MTGHVCSCAGEKMERETGFEPATSTLARLHSTTELFPPGGSPLSLHNRPRARQPGRTFVVGPLDRWPPGPLYLRVYSMRKLLPTATGRPGVT